MRLLRPEPLIRYLAAVSVGGAATLTAVLASSGSKWLVHPRPAVLILAALVVVGEVFPIKLPYGEGEFTTSTTFAYAVLLYAGLAPALVALAVGSAITDAVRSRSAWKLLFNVGQYTLSLSASALVLGALSDVPSGSHHFAPSDLPAILAAGAVFFLLNNALAGTASAIAAGDSVVRHLRTDVAEQAWTAAMLLGLAPVVVVATDFSALLLPWLLLPMAAVYRGGQATLFRHQALHDGLTGLPNRELFRDHAVEALTEAKRNRQSFAIVAIDLDRFKQVNDSLGHHRGDLLLRGVGPRLEGAAGEGATVARLGGDEFALILPGAGLEEALLVCERTTAALGEPFLIEGLPLEVGGSMGIACYPDHGDDVELLTQRADAALYRAKRKHSHVETWAPGESFAMPDALALAVKLRRALDDEELTVHYQPKVALRGGAVCGVEALVRWDHPNDGLVGPDRFVPLAERTGLIRRLTDYVIDRAMRDRQEWLAAGVDLSVSVNLSASVLDRELPRLVRTRLDAQAAPARALMLELTESHAMADPQAALEVLAQLAALGVRLSIDDFGTGHSSLAYLQQLPVSELKIDKSFVEGGILHGSDATIIRSTIDLGHDLGLDVVAEGVEDPEAWRQLASMGCDVAQGFLISRPMPADRIVEWVRDGWAPGASPVKGTFTPVRT
jgi:diguanylate cyclase (GGDEF)-like protein